MPIEQELSELRELVAAMRSQLTVQQQEISSLKSSLPVSATDPQTSAPDQAKVGRRRWLRRMVLAGVGAGASLTTLASQPSPVHAEIRDVPGTGAVAIRDNIFVTGDISPTAFYGLIGSPDPIVSLTPFSTGDTQAGVLGYTAQDGGAGVSGKGPRTGIFGTTENTINLKPFPHSDFTCGVLGYTTASNGSGVAGHGYLKGVYGYSPTVGVTGVSTGTNIIGVGVTGECHSEYGTGVRGTSSAGWGVTGQTGATAGSSLTNFWSGVYGATSNGGAYTAGVRGNGQNIGVWGYCTGTNGGGVGVYGNQAGGAYAGYFAGKVHITGTLSKSGGTFKIDHPLDPENKYLSHSFVESPDMLNLYNGVVSLDGEGYAEVRLPNWFESLNSDYRYQLTALGSASPDLHIAGKVADGRFKIAGGQPGQEVSWQVTGIRQDAWAKANPVVVEEEKSKAEQGYFLNPEVFGFGADKHIDINARTEK
jgi:hypothetical protein